MNKTLRRRRRREDNKIKLIATLILTAVVLTFIFNILLSSSEVKGELDISTKGYITVTIHSNDTLWSIADEYMNRDYYTYETFIAEVSEMNTIDASEIYAGEQIIIPVIASSRSYTGTFTE